MKKKDEEQNKKDKKGKKIKVSDTADLLKD
jgi:hypothetical protein